MLEYKSGRIIARLDKTEKVIVEDVNFSICDGASLALMGETGAGKTTIASSVMGLLPENLYIESGCLVLGGKELSLTERRKALGKDIVYIPQSGHECLNKTRKIKHQFADSKHKMAVAAQELLSMVGFKNADKIMDMYPFELSGGMAQRVVIALAASQNPKLVIADEPTNGIDESFADDFLPLLDKLFPNASRLIITHDINLAEKCDSILVLKKNDSKLEKAEFLENFVKDSADKEAGSDSILLKCENLSKSFASKKVLSNACLEIPRGCMVGLLGPSGIGKSSLAKIITGLERPDSGPVYFDNKTIFDGEKYDRKSALAIQMVYQQPYAVLDPSQKIRSGLKELIKYHRIPYADNIDAFIDSLAAELSLTGEVLNHLPIQISGGEAQRAAILKCLLLQPKLLILDEATSMLDEVTQQEILIFIKNEMQKNGGSILMISHNEKLTREYCDKVCKLDNGIILEI